MLRVLWAGGDLVGVARPSCWGSPGAARGGKGTQDRRLRIQGSCLAFPSPGGAVGLPGLGVDQGRPLPCGLGRGTRACCLKSAWGSIAGELHSDMPWSCVVAGRRTGGCMASCLGAGGSGWELSGAGAAFALRARPRHGGIAGSEARRFRLRSGGRPAPHEAWAPVGVWGRWEAGVFRGGGAKSILSQAFKGGTERPTRCQLKTFRTSAPCRFGGAFSCVPQRGEELV